MPNRDLNVTLSGDGLSLKRELAAADAAARKTAKAIEVLDRQVQQSSRSHKGLTEAQKQQLTVQARQAQETRQQAAALRTLGLSQKEVNAHVSRFGSNLGTSRKRAEESVVTNAALTGSFRGMARAAVTAGAGFAAVYVAISKGKQAVAATTELAHQTEVLHKVTHMSIKSSSEWAGMAQVRGIAANQLGMGFTKLSTAFLKADAGGKASIQVMKSLGISQADVHKGAGDLQFAMFRTADALKQQHNATVLNVGGQTLLGRSWRQLIPVLGEGKKGLQDQLALADKYHVTLNGKTIKSLDDLRRSERELKYAQLGLQVQFTEKIAPALITVASAGAKVIGIFDDPKLSGDQKWKQIGAIVGPLATNLEHGAEQAIPHIADAVGREAPKVAGAFVTGFLHAGPMGQLAIGAFMLSKLGAWGLVGRKIGAILGIGIAEGETAGATTGALTKTGRSWGALLGRVAGPVWVASMIAQIAKVENADPLLFLHPPKAGDPRPGHGDIQPVHPKNATRADATLSAAQVLIASRSSGNAAAVMKDTNALKDYGARAVIVAGEITKLNNLHGTAKTRAEALWGQIETLTSKMGHLRKGSAEYNTTAAELRKKELAFNAALGDTKPAADKAGKGLKGLGKNAGNLQDAVNSAATSIAGVTNSLLKDFGAKPIHFSVSKASQAVQQVAGTVGGSLFERGGLVQYGSPGEKGHDSIFTMLAGAPAVVAPGEKGAVFTGQQQGVMDYALANIGIPGLDGLFSTYSQPHYMAKGGYVFPFPKGARVGWNRIDQGQDFQGTPGGPLLAIGPGGVTRAPNDPGGFGPDYPLLTLTAGPLRGKTIYYGHTDIAHSGGAISAGDVIARTSTKGHNAPPGWAEIGFWPPGSMSAGNAIAPILHALAGNRAVAGMGGGSGQVGMPKIGGPAGPLKSIAVGAAKRLTKAANAYLSKKTAANVSALSASASYTGSGAFRATSYGPPWGGIEGGGRTATGIDLSRSPHKYLVAVDPSVIPLHSQLLIQPNPFNTSSAFAAEDTGGAIKGKRIDFYDWRGRTAQNAWGSRSVEVKGYERGGFVGMQGGGFVGGDGGSIADVVAASVNPFLSPPPKKPKKPKRPKHHRNPNAPRQFTVTDSHGVQHVVTMTPKQHRAYLIQQHNAKNQAKNVLAHFTAGISSLVQHEIAPVTALDTQVTGLSDAYDDIGQDITFETRQIGDTADDTTTAGRAAHITALQELRSHIQSREGGNLGKRKKLLAKEANRLRKLIADLQKRAKKAPKAARKGLQNQIARYQRQLAAVKKQAHQIGLDIGNLALDELGIGKQIEDIRKQEPTAADTALAHLNAATALAALTPDTGDDIKAAQGLVDFYGGQLAWAQATGDDTNIAQAAQNLKGAQDALKQLNDAAQQSQADLAQALKDLKASIDQQNQMISAVQNTDAAVLAKALADIVSGQIVGYGVTGRQLTAGAGSTYRY